MAIGVVSLSYLLLLCLPLLSEGRETRRPLRSVKAPAGQPDRPGLAAAATPACMDRVYIYYPTHAETIVDYDVATPAVAYRSSQDVSDVLLCVVMRSAWQLHFHGSL